MHYIQRKILLKLLYAKSLPYARMCPAGIESNHFAYHLDQLLRAGLVAKRDKRYFLAPQGLALVDRMSQEKMVGRQQAHILTVVAVTNDRGKTLLYQRHFQPYIDTIGFPLGKTHLSEKAQVAAERELQEKTGLTGIPLTQRGIVYVHVTQAGVTITHALCHVFSGRVQGEPVLSAPNLRGACFWMDASSLKKDLTTPGFFEISLLVGQPEELFFAEISHVRD